MKIFLALFITVIYAQVAVAQNSYLDSLEQNLKNSVREDSNRVKALCALADYYGFIQLDSCLYFAARSSTLAGKLNYVYGEYITYLSTFHGYNTQGNYPLALKAALNYMKSAERLKRERPEAMTQAFYTMGLLNKEMSNFEEAKVQFEKGIEWQKTIGQPERDVFACYSQIGLVYNSQKKLDSALWCVKKGYALGLNSIEYKKYFLLAIGALGNIYLALGNYKLAEEYFRDAIEQSGYYNNIYFKVRNYNNLAGLFDRTNQKDSSIYYARISLQQSQKHNFAEFTLDASKLLTKIYESEGRSDSTLKFMKIMLAAKDSVFSQSRGQQFRQLAFDEIMQRQEADQAKEKYQYRTRSYALLAALLFLLILTLMFYRSARQKQRSNIKIESAFNSLKAAQAQLIQSEKMASLGELTAGIAHEIQNPLNFVNNFSEVNAELIEEMKEEINKGNIDEVRTIAENIQENEHKISHHGRRADGIVKSMLQHSQSSTGIKTPTDLNALSEEYLRLAYHGIRAKEKSFNPILKTDFDRSIGNINLIPQDIGRVLLNLYNNSFYAVNEKAKILANGFEPTVYVLSKKMNDRVEIRIKDNGNGISSQVVDKIFQPFFTTKPTGQGTGLGLSLSYDIIKTLGGEIKVNTRENEFTEFVISLPLS